MYIPKKSVCVCVCVFGPPILFSFFLMEAVLADL